MKIEPKKLLFCIQDFSESLINSIWIRIEDINNSENIIKNVNHSEFNKKFINTSDCIFESIENISVDEIKKFLFSIGMNEMEEK